MNRWPRSFPASEHPFNGLIRNTLRKKTSINQFAISALECSFNHFTFSFLNLKLTDGKRWEKGNAQVLQACSKYVLARPLFHVAPKTFISKCFCNLSFLNKNSQETSLAHQASKGQKLSNSLIGKSASLTLHTTVSYDGPLCSQNKTLCCSRRYSYPSKEAFLM